MKEKEEVKQILLQYEAWFETDEFEKVMDYIEHSSLETRDCDSCFFNVINDYEKNKSD